MIVNVVVVISIDIVYWVWFDLNVDLVIFVVVFYNSVIFVFVEIMGCSYGGGILELEFREVE